MSGVETRSLADCAEWKSGGTPRTTVPEYWDGSIPWITSGSLDGFLLRDSDRKLTIAGARSGSRIVPPGSTLFVVRGMSLAKEFRVGIAQCPLAFGQDCKALLPHDDIDPYYLAQAIRAQTSTILGLVEYAAHGTGKLNTDQLKALQIPVPALAVQQRIAAAVTAFDVLIENNLRRIEVLEEMAQAVYREWFVNFRYPGHEDAEMVDSALGRIPVGWWVSRVGDAVQINPRRKHRQGGEYRFFPMASLAVGSMVVEGFEAREKPAGSQFSNGDTLLARITPSLENGKTGFVQCLDLDEIACGSTEFIVLRSSSLVPEFVYLLARDDGFRGVAINSMVGASGRQRVQEPSIAGFEFAHPPSEVLGAFRDAVRPMFRLVQSLVDQNANLRSTRDLLLPRLVSGELDVSDLDIDTDWLAA